MTSSILMGIAIYTVAGAAFLWLWYLKHEREVRRVERSAMQSSSARELADTAHEAGCMARGGRLVFPGHSDRAAAAERLAHRRRREVLK